MIVEIFSCLGGMAEGMRRAGLAPDVAVDYDADARTSYAANHGLEPLDCDVKRDLPALAALLRDVGSESPSGRIDLLVADPPCVAWSYSGKRQGVEDPRDCLLETCALVEALRPRAWCIANVPGLDAKPNRWIVQETIEKLPGFTAYARLDAADFGVPQRRKRPFWVGFEDERARAAFRWPQPTHCDPKRINGHDLKPWVTCRQALGHLEDLGRPIRIDWPRTEGQPPSPDTVGRTLNAARQNGNGGYLSIPWHLPQGQRYNVPDDVAQCVSGKVRAGQGEATLLWPWDRPGTSIKSDDRLAQPGHHDGWPMANAVVLSEKARLILQGFPEDWVVVGRTKGSRDSQIGQAFPPPFAEAVFRQIKIAMRAG